MELGHGLYVDLDVLTQHRVERRMEVGEHGHVDSRVLKDLSKLTRSARMEADCTRVGGCGLGIVLRLPRVAEINR